MTNELDKKFYELLSKIETMQQQDKTFTKEYEETYRELNHVSRERIEYMEIQNLRKEESL